MTDRLRPPNPIFAGRIRHGVSEYNHRHRHEVGFLAIVLEGRYVEAGDTGQHTVGPGDFIFHRRWESHLNHVGPSGSNVLILPVDGTWSESIRGCIIDPDVVVRIAERDAHAAVSLVAETAVGRVTTDHDWPALLATQLRHDPETELDVWAREMGLHPGSLSRGFRQVFGTTPAAYRLAQKIQRALIFLEEGATRLATIAADSGFADQPHMNRAVRKATGCAPSALRL
jgi:AraC-like DNA-binding protein